MRHFKLTFHFVCNFSLILGFVTKKEADAIIQNEPSGTFIIRFRDTGIEKSNRDCPRASLSVVYKTGKTFFLKKI